MGRALSGSATLMFAFLTSWHECLTQSTSQDRAESLGHMPFLGEEPFFPTPIPLIKFHLHPPTLTQIPPLSKASLMFPRFLRSRILGLSQLCPPPDRKHSPALDAVLMKSRN